MRNIALLGDIAPVCHPIYEEILAFVAKHYERVFVVAGVSEYYGGASIETTETCINEVGVGGAVCIQLVVFLCPRNPSHCHLFCPIFRYAKSLATYSI